MLFGVEQKAFPAQHQIWPGADGVASDQGAALRPVEGQMTGTLPAYIQVTRTEGKVTELSMQLPLGEKNIRPDKLCAELFAPGYKIKQIKRIKFLFK